MKIYKTCQNNLKYVHNYKVAVNKTLNFRNAKVFLPQEKKTLLVFGKTMRNVWSSMRINFVLYLAFLNIIYSSVTDKSFVDETRVSRKYKISILGIYEEFIINPTQHVTFNGQK